jgi:hypothetical protein
MSARATATFVEGAVQALQLDPERSGADDPALALLTAAWAWLSAKGRTIQEIEPLWADDAQLAYVKQYPKLSGDATQGQTIVLSVHAGILETERAGYRLGSRTSPDEVASVARHLASLLLQDSDPKRRSRVGWTLALLPAIRWQTDSVHTAIRQAARIGDPWLDSDDPVSFYEKSRQQLSSHVSSKEPALVEAEAAANAQFFAATCNAYSALIAEDGDMFAKMYFLQAARGIIHGEPYGCELLERRLGLAAEAGYRWRVAEALATLEDPLSVKDITAAIHKAASDRSSEGRQLNHSHVADIALMASFADCPVQKGSRGNLIPGIVFFFAGFEWAVRGYSEWYPQPVRTLLYEAFQAGATYRDAERLLLEPGQPELGADEQVCPDCAEVIKASARICRFCRHSFVD